MIKRPHILIFNPDQWRGGVLGNLGNTPAQAPNIDKLVGSEAISFKAEVRSSGDFNRPNEIDLAI